MTGLCEGRVVVVTGAGRGLGRSHALEFARQGAKVVVNDLGTNLDGSGNEAALAESVAAEIGKFGGEAIASTHDVSDWEQAGELIDLALSGFGGLDTVVANAGILRDRTIANMTIQEWDDVVRVNLRGTFCVVRQALDHWRSRAKSGETVAARVVTMTSGAGLYGNVGQANYGATKAGIAAFTRILAAEAGRYGVLANCVSPLARSRMSETLYADAIAPPAEGFDAMSPDNISPLVAWLGSDDCAGISGEVFEMTGGKITVAEGWHPGPSVDSGDHWDPQSIGEHARALVDKAGPHIPVYGSSPGAIGEKSAAAT